MTDRDRQSEEDTDREQELTSEHIPELTGFPLRWCRRGNNDKERGRDRKTVIDRVRKIQAEHMGSSLIFQS